eukprot:NODE_2287_length_1095_cov_69.303719_g2269_i0.p1 GENE.NODE_2287_length_1095_cov_69.303719_g2269_i0~~NODE_2287_length_1095_cov_69.303719_g2269_i0.p1  ORF type:complete len:294 (+),score=39.47 NODE_2287_length_1095_cov_69.303719_g2269_i0:69-950(+)
MSVLLACVYANDAAQLRHELRNSTYTHSEFIAAFVEACARGLPQLVDAFLQHEHADRNNHVNDDDSHGRTPLTAACNRGDVGVVNALIAAGADVTLQDAQGQSPLYWCSWQGHADCLDAVLRAPGVYTRDAAQVCNCNSCVANHSSVATMSRSRSATKHVVCCRNRHACLCAGGYEMVDVAANYSVFPLFTACYHHKPDVVRVLLDAGADPHRVFTNESDAFNWRNEKDMDSAAVARKQGAKDCAELVEAAKNATRRPPGEEQIDIPVVPPQSAKEVHIATPDEDVRLPPGFD